MKNLLGFLKANDFKACGFQSLNAKEMYNIRGGSEPVKPVTPPRDRFDEEEQ